MDDLKIADGFNYKGNRLTWLDLISFMWLWEKITNKNIEFQDHLYEFLDIDSNFSSKLLIEIDLISISNSLNKIRKG